VDDTFHNEQLSGLRSLERKVSFGFIVALLVLLLIGALSYFSVLRSREDNAWIDHTHQVLDSLSGLVSDLNAAETKERGFLLTGREEYQQAYREAVKRVQEQLQGIDELIRDNPIQGGNFGILAPLVAQRLTLMQSHVELRLAVGLAPVQAALMKNDEGNELNGAIRAAVSKMQGEENSLLQEREKRAELSSLQTRAAITTGGILAIALLIAALYVIREGFKRGRAAEAELHHAKSALEQRVEQGVAELTRTGAAVQAGEERLSRIIDSAMDAILTVDEQQRITMFNPAAEAMFKCPAKDALGTPLERFLPARFRATHVEHMRAFGQ